MTTFAELVDETMGMFGRFTGVVEQSCALQNSIDASETTLLLTDHTMIGRGLYEVDEELVLAQQGDSLSGTLVLVPFGRGQQGTAKVAHAAGARVTRAPRLPRARVKSTLNEVLAGLYPDLYAVKTDGSNRANLTQWGYPLPLDVEEVLDVQYSAPPWGNWIGVRRWRVDAKADTTDFATGYSLAIADPIWTGARLKVTYKSRPGRLVNDSDDFAAVTGLQGSASDLVVLGACAKLVAADELMRTQTNSVEQSQRSTISPAGAAANASRLMTTMFNERLEVERRALQARYGAPRIVRTWT
jgi:hypothetical protein